MSYPGYHVNPYRLDPPKTIVNDPDWHHKQVLASAEAFVHTLREIQALPVTVNCPEEEVL